MTGLPSLQDAARHRPAAPAHRDHALLEADHPDRRRGRRAIRATSPASSATSPSALERDAATIETGQNIHYIRSSAPSVPRSSLGDVPHAPALLLSGEPVPGSQQRAQGRQRARHLRHPGLLGGDRVGRQPRSARQRLHREPVLQQPRHLRHPAGAPRRHQAVRASPAQNPSSTAGSFPSPACTKSAAAALDRADQRVDRLHARLRESLRRLTRSVIATD